MTKYGEFQEKGYTVVAELPSHSKEAQEWVVSVSRDGMLVCVDRIPLILPPVFGPDVADVAELEARVETLLAELP